MLTHGFVYICKLTLDLECRCTETSTCHYKNRHRLYKPSVAANPAIMSQAFLSTFGSSRPVSKIKIKEEVEDRTTLTCQHCRMQTEMWCDDARNTTPFSCNVCQSLGMDDINHRCNWKTATTRTNEAEPCTTTTDNFPKPSIYWTSLMDQKSSSVNPSAMQ